MPNMHSVAESGRADETRRLLREPDRSILGVIVLFTCDPVLISIPGSGFVQFAIVRTGGQSYRKRTNEFYLSPVKYVPERPQTSWRAEAI
jgi:hypothetical protein